MSFIENEMIVHENDFCCMLQMIANMVYIVLRPRKTYALGEKNRKSHFQGDFFGKNFTSLCQDCRDPNVFFPHNPFMAREPVSLATRKLLLHRK